MDKIIIEGASFLTHVGVTEHERSRKQEILVDLHAFIDLLTLQGKDDIAATVSYVDIHELAAQTITARPYRLIETIAENVAAAVMQRFERLAGVTVRIHNLEPCASEACDRLPSRSRG